MTTHKNYIRWLTFVLLVGPICLFHWKILFLGQLPDGGDMLNQFIPWREFALSCLSAGYLPLWNSYVFCGVPFWANIQTALLFPWNVLHLVLDVPEFFAFCIVIHHLIAAIGMYLFFLNRRFGRVPALIAATVYAWSGFFILHSNDGHLIHIQAYAYIPFCLFAQDRLRTGFSWLRVTGLAAPLAMMILAGHLQLPLYTFYLLLFRAFWPQNSGFSFKTVGRNLIRTGTGIAASLLICSAVILPLLQFSGYSSTRAGGAEYKFATHDSMPPAHLLTLFAPFFYGDPTYEAPDRKFWETITGYHEICGYAGVVSIVLAFFAFVPLPHPHGDMGVAPRRESEGRGESSPPVSTRMQRIGGRDEMDSQPPPNLRSSGEEQVGLYPSGSGEEKEGASGEEKEGTPEEEEDGAQRGEEKIARGEEKEGAPEEEQGGARREEKERGCPDHSLPQRLTLLQKVWNTDFNPLLTSPDLRGRKKTSVSAAFSPPSGPRSRGRVGETQRGLNASAGYTISPNESDFVTERRFALCLLIVALLLALGHYTPLYRIPYHLFPGFAYFRVPGRLVLFYGLAVSILAGLGTLRLCRAGWWQVRQHPAVAAVLGTGFLLIVFTLLAYLNRHGIWDFLHHIEVERSREAVGLPPEAYNAIAAQIPANLIDGRCEAVLRGLSIACVWFWAGLLAIGAVGRLPNKAVWACVLLWGLLFADLLWFAHRFIPTFPEEQWKTLHYRETEPLQIAGRDTQHRTLFTDEIVIGRGVPGHSECKHNRPMLFGVRAVRGYDPIQLSTFAAFVNTIQGRHPDTKQGGMLYIRQAAGVHPHGYDRTATRYVITTLDVPDAFDLVWADPYSPLRMYENPAPQTIVRLVENSEGVMEVEEQRPGRMVATVRLKEPSSVFFSQCVYPGWGVTVDGVDSEIALVDGVFMQVRVPEGEHTVRFEFTPSVVYAGVAVSVVTLILLVLLSLWSLRRKAANGEGLVSG